MLKGKKMNGLVGTVVGNCDEAGKRYIVLLDGQDEVVRIKVGNCECVGSSERTSVKEV